MGALKGVGGDVLDILLFCSHKRIEYERSPHRGMGSDPPGTRRTLDEEIELAPPQFSLAEITNGERNPAVH
jgi:hypothetical protein